MAWDTLEELRTAALDCGYTASHFADAVSAVGYDPNRVAVFLQRYRIEPPAADRDE